MKKPIVIIAVVAALMLSAGLGGGYYLSSAGLWPFNAAEGEAAEEEAANAEPAGLVTMEAFLTNVRGPGGSHHVRVSVELAISPEERAAKIQDDKLLMARLRDQILTLLSNRTTDELSSAEGKQALRGQIHQKLTDVIKDGRLQEVLFSDFVVQ